MGHYQQYRDTIIRNIKETLEGYLKNEAGSVGFVLPDNEQKIIKYNFIEPLERGDDVDTIGIFLICGLKFGLFPSDVIKSIDNIFSRVRKKLAASEEDDVDSEILQKALSNDNEWLFWKSCFSIFNYDYKEAVSYLEEVIKDAQIPRNILLAALLLKIWSLTSLERYAEVQQVLKEKDVIKDNFDERYRYRLTYFIGYVTGLSQTIPEFSTDDFLSLHVLPEVEFGEHHSKELQPYSEEQKLSTEESLKLLRFSFEKVIREESNKSREEIRVLTQPSYEKAQEILVKEHGEWINKCKNPSSLFTAEFLFNTLNARSWGEVGSSFSNVTEAEVETLVHKLFSYLNSKGVSNMECRDGAILEFSNIGNFTLGSFEKFLESVILDKMRLALIKNILAEKFHSFTFDELPKNLNKLNEIRIICSHGTKANFNVANKAREIVLGVDSKPGLLEKIYDVNCQIS